MEVQSEEMKLKKHRGARVKRGGVIVMEDDYDGNYAIRFKTEHDEEHEYVLSRAQVDRLNVLTEDKIGQCETENSLLSRLKTMFRVRK